MKLLYGIVLSTVIVGNTFAQSNTSPIPFAPIQHWVVIYLENHSFDNLYGRFQGADNLDSAHLAHRDLQLDGQGHSYTILPSVNRPHTNDSLFKNLPNKPFLIDHYMSQSQETGDLVHRFYQNQAQIDSGRNDKFVLFSDAKALSVGYYNTDSLNTAKYAHQYVLCDHFFQSAFGGSFLNHQYLIAAAAPNFHHPPLDAITILGADGIPTHDGTVAVVNGDTVAVNTIYSRIAPHPSSFVDTNKMLPALTNMTIGDRLDQAGISWKWYSGGWDLALDGKGDSVDFQYHHQPFAYFKNYQVGSVGGQKHLRDERELFVDIQQSKLPQVVFWKPVGDENEHPGYANVTAGEKKVQEVIWAIQHSSAWKDVAIIITYDENGGFWDHVAPPRGDVFGPSMRVPTLVISPWAKKGYVDPTIYETVSILSTLEARYGLKPLTHRDSLARPLFNVFDFTSHP